MFKKILIAIDKLVSNGALKKYYDNKSEAQILNLLEFELGYKSTIFYPKNMSCELSHLCDFYGSDKGELHAINHPYPWPSHTYTDYYSRLFSHRRNDVRNIFECGIGTNNPSMLSSMGPFGKPGASLRVWRDFFPNSMVYGADIDKDILFEENRIKSFYVDQLNPASIVNLWDRIGVRDFDLMVDDGLHTFEAGSTLFLHSIDRLAVDGLYVIEDVSLSDLLIYKEFFSAKDFLVEYVCLSRPKFGLWDNNLIVIRNQF